MAIHDCICCFGENAWQFKDVRPQIQDDATLELKDARHPVIERHLPVGESYIANDIILDKEQQQIIILTGPNMSGKSALLRQTGLIVLMAHRGSCVPASAAPIT